MCHPDDDRKKQKLAYRGRKSISRPCCPIWKGMKRTMALRKKVVCLLALALALLMLCGTAMADNFSFLPSRTENGKEYLAHPSSDLTTILLIGYDHYANGQIEGEPSQYHLGGQSDFLLLLVIDHKNQQIHQL